MKMSSYNKFITTQLWKKKKIESYFKNNVYERLNIKFGRNPVFHVFRLDVRYQIFGCYSIKNNRSRLKHLLVTYYNI